MATAIAFRFPGGRYHATPWDAHVNEADVEWPPSPWRILRALIATWHRKADPDTYPEPVLEALVARLAEAPPSYRLPLAAKSHTRHFMPAPVKRTMIFDAFLQLDPTAELIVAWPELTLDAPERTLLSDLLGRIGYLGRAESWVEARLVDDWDGRIDCAPAGWSRDAEDGVRTEPVSLAAPIPADAYSRWRQEMIDKLGLGGRRRTAKQRRLLKTLPEPFIDALRLETTDIRDNGWRQPPGAMFITYHRPADCFRPRPGPTVSTRNRAVHSARLALARLNGTPLPRLEDAVRIGELTRLAAIRRAQDVVGDGELPSELTGHDLPSDASHVHAFYLPEDADRDGRIDHVLVHAPGGLSREALEALGRIDRLWRGDGEWAAVLETYGERPGDVGSTYGGSGPVWTSITPYLHPWHAKKGFGVPEQVERECRARGLPAVVNVEPVPAVRIRGRDRRPVHFHRFRSRRGLMQPDTKGHFVRITFAEAVDGPLALGFGCHYGLGVFGVVSA